MNKKIILVALAALALASCGGDATSTGEEEPPVSSSGVEEPLDAPIGELQTVFARLAEGDFHVEYELDYASSSGAYAQTADYTEYAIETDGYFGFNAVAQGDGFIFPYYRSGNQIVSQAPSIDSYTGLRYATLADYRPTFRDFDYTMLPEEPDDDGYYTYAFGLNSKNDSVLSTICMLYSSAATPSSLRFRVIGNSLVSYGVGIDYGEAQDTVTARISGIGTTEIEDIKAYLDGGGTAKEYVSDRFVAFLLPYLISKNYSIDVDLSDVDSTGISVPVYHKAFTEYSEHSYVGSFESGSGFVEFMGAVSRYTIDEDGNAVLGQYAYADSSGTTMSDLWAEEVGISFLDVTASNLTGYMSEEDGVTCYHMTDTQFISAVANVANLGYDDTFYVSEVVISIDDYGTGAFTARFDYYVRSSNRDLGTAYAKFHSRNATENEAVDVLLSEGDQAETQTTEELQAALDLFGQDNYRQYALGDSSVVEYVFDEEYTYYRYVTGDADTGEGYLKEDGRVKQYSLASGTVSVGNASSNISLPGTSSSYSDNYDMGYFSSPKMYAGGILDEEASAAAESSLLGADNYGLYAMGGVSFWANDDPELLFWASSYFSWIVSGYGFAGVSMIGVRFHNFVEGEASQAGRLTFYLFTYDYGGNYYYSPFTFFDLGNASVFAVEEYLHA